MPLNYVPFGSGRKICKRLQQRWSPPMPRQVRIEFPGAGYHVMCVATTARRSSRTTRTGSVSSRRSPRRANAPVGGSTPTCSWAIATTCWSRRRRRTWRRGGRLLLGSAGLHPTQPGAGGARQGGGRAATGGRLLPLVEPARVRPTPFLPLSDLHNNVLRDTPQKANS